MDKQLARPDPRYNILLNLPKNPKFLNKHPNATSYILKKLNQRAYLHLGHQILRTKPPRSDKFSIQNSFMLT